MKDETHVEISIHGCTGFRVARYFPDINNAITLEFSTATGTIMVQTFGLERDVTADLMGKFSDDHTLFSRHSVLAETAKRDRIDLGEVGPSGGAAA